MLIHPTNHQAAIRQTVTLRVTPWSDLSVSRDIEICTDQSLDELHLAIQEAFELDNDHLHAFYLNDHAWDRQFGYSGGHGAEGRSTREACLSQFTLPKNKQFLYIFDFGDDLRHRVKVVAHGTSDAGASYPRIVAKIGKAPPQYRDWSDVAPDENASEAKQGGVPCCGTEIRSGLGEPERQQMATLVPRIKVAIDAHQRRLYDEPCDMPRTVEVLADEFGLARSLFELTKGDPATIHLEVEHSTNESVWGWLSTLPNELSEALMDAEALELAQRVLLSINAPDVRLKTPLFLLRAKRAQDALAMLAENLQEYPQNSTALLEAAQFQLAFGDKKAAEAHYREALEWAGSNRSLRECIVSELKELLRDTGQIEAIKPLMEQEKRLLDVLYPPWFATHPAPLPVRHQTPKVGRNDPCPCGSGKKSKKCCARAN